MGRERFDILWRQRHGPRFGYVLAVFGECRSDAARSFDIREQHHLVAVLVTQQGAQVARAALVASERCEIDKRAQARAGLGTGFDVNASIAAGKCLLKRGDGRFRYQVIADDLHERRALDRIDLAVVRVTCETIRSVPDLLSSERRRLVVVRDSARKARSAGLNALRSMADIYSSSFTARCTRMSLY